MTDKVKQLESTVTILKARLFDINEELSVASSNIQTLNSLVSKIVEKIGLEAVDGQVTIEAILSKLDEILPKKVEADSE